MKLFFISGVAVLGFGLALQHIVPLPANNAGRLATLRAERDALAGNDDALLMRLRKETRTGDTVAWSSRRVQQWAGGLGPRWRARSGDQPGICVVTREPDQAGDWAPFLAALREWSRMPGVTIEEVEIEAAGPAGRRHFARRNVTLRFALETKEENSTQTEKP